MPVVYYFPAWAFRTIESRHKAAATSLKTVITLKSKGDGKPVQGATVVAFTDFANRVGAQGTTNKQGVVRLSLDGAAKIRCMSEAHALLMASVREGWGLVVTECNACGTPAVVYDVPGLRDSVRHLETGLIVRPHPELLAQGMVTLITDAALYRRLQDQGRQWSKSFTFEAGARIVRERITNNPTYLVPSRN